MRVIAGEKRGLVLVSPEGDDVRPTHDRVREAVFGRLQFFIQGKTFLDLFAGSGAMGIEALSRGAEKALFVDNSRSSVEIINKNISKAGFGDSAQVIFSDYSQALGRIKKQSVDVVYIDPPYASGVYGDALELIRHYDILTDDARVVLESDCEMQPSEGFDLEKSKRYGKAFITYLRKNHE